MCSVVILRRPGHAWPVLIAANRDERRDRPAKPPAAHWPERPDVLAGLDVLAGGSWLGMNRHGVVAAVLNREGTLGPAAGKRSRGELVLDALDYPDARDAAEALAELDPAAYRTFNLMIADESDAFLLANRDPTGGFPVGLEKLPVGLSMVTARERDDPRSVRIRLHRPRFLSAPVPEPSTGNWTAWEKILASRDSETDRTGAMFIDPPAADPMGFGTVSSSLIALPNRDLADIGPVWRYAEGPPEDRLWLDVL